MEMTGRIVRQISLLSLLILVVPMTLFPERLSMKLAEASLIYVIYELVYYSIVSYFLFRRASFFRIIQVAGICLVYRLLLGAVFGLLIAAVYSTNLTISLTLGMSSYLPAILLHIAVTPFILKPVASQLLTSTKDIYRPVKQAKTIETPVNQMTPTTAFTEMKASKTNYTVERTKETPPLREARTWSSSGIGPAEANGFDRAVRYIGEDSSVKLAVVVDHEGLLLGRFIRGQVIAEDWAPLTLLVCDANRAALQRVGWDTPEKIDLVAKDTRIIVAHEESLYLMVMAQRRADDLLNIKINQGLEMIRKHMAQRYSQELSRNVEKIYVSSA